MNSRKENFSRLNSVVLFDVDGTLTEPRQNISSEMEEVLQQLKKKVQVGLVGGSDYSKIKNQMNNRSIENEYDFVFCENGLTGFLHSKEFPSKSILDFYGEKKIQEFLDFVLIYIATLRIPIKRGTFIEFRKGMINVSPIGRNCSQEERIKFFEYDKIERIRETMIEVLKTKFPEMNMNFVIGGQISIDCFPKGWDKTFCLDLIEDYQFKNIYFYGDKTQKGGNDYEIFNDQRTVGRTVTSPKDTIKKIFSDFLL